MVSEDIIAAVEGVVLEALEQLRYSPKGDFMSILSDASAGRLDWMFVECSNVHFADLSVAPLLNYCDS